MLNLFETNKSNLGIDTYEYLKVENYNKSNLRQSLVCTHFELNLSTKKH